MYNYKIKTIFFRPEKVYSSILEDGKCQADDATAQINVSRFLISHKYKHFLKKFVILDSKKGKLQPFNFV